MKGHPQQVKYLKRRRSRISRFITFFLINPYAFCYLIIKRAGWLTGRQFVKIFFISKRTLKRKQAKLRRRGCLF